MSLPTCNETTRRLNPQIFGTAERAEPEANAPRTNARNTGKTFEKEIERTLGAYHSKRVAVVRKVDPPVAIIWPFNPKTGKNEQRVIFKQNPYLDFLGTWTARHGRMILIECKSTSTHRLPFKRHGGLTDEQLAAIKTWRLAGAAAIVLWQFGGKVCLWTPEMLVAAEGRAEKSLVFASGLAVERGEGTLIWDFLAVLERELFPQPCE